LVEADLTNNAVWDKIVEGCDYVLHVASPFPNKPPKDEKELTVPAVNGTRSVLEAAIKHKVKHIIITSSIAAIFSGQNKKNFFTD